MKRGKRLPSATTAMTVASPRALVAPWCRFHEPAIGVSGAKKKTAKIIARNPFRVVAGALALGFVFAKLRAIF